MQFRFKSMVFAGDTIRCESEVTSVARADDGLVVSLAQRVLVGDRVAVDSATMELRTPP